MTTHSEPEIVLYDLACIKDACFSPTVWRIRLMLNYKRIPYKTIFLEFPDIEPTLKEPGLTPGKTTTGSQSKYTVPAIKHVPTNRCIMDSLVIAQFLESIYSEPPVPLTSELGRQIQVKSRSILGKTLSDSIMPREIYILSPRAQEYFRRTREASIGRSLEDVLDPTKEEQDWLAIDPELRAIGELMRTNKDEGPFILGAKPTYADFFIAGTLQCARMVDEGVFQRFMKYPGYKGIYEGCRPYMERND
uniref:Beta-etherase n=1 Tax=Talaromyces marneffei PM1 TaxID=1077442 RepID=A0A093VSS0_TALMA